MSHQHDGHESPPSFWSSRYAIGYVAIGAVAAYFLLTEHLAAGRVRARTFCWQL